MATGILYIMTTAVPDLIKIGITQEKQYPERMRYLEMNGYYNVVGLKRVFAIKVSDYQEKERLLQDIFSKKNFDYSGHLLGLMTMVNTQRIFITKDSDIPIDVQIINKQSGYQVSKAFFPYESSELFT